jgi:2-polyprenyl-6-methoxyphenol hydroxylase-like FAD-dependent oxidoreductase
MSTNEILVAGGGIGGLAAALALARKGLRVRVLEKAAEFGEIGYGIQMGPNVARMLDHLGILQAIEAHAFFPGALVFMDALDDTEVTRIAVGKFFRERYGYRYFVVHRRDLHGEILAACRRHDTIALEASKGVAGFEQHAETVLVRCDDGSQYEGTALIGADGLRSQARTAMLADGPPRMSGHYVYRGVVPMDEIVDRSHADDMTIWGGPDLHLVQYRLRGGTVMNNVATVVSKRHVRGEPDAGAPDELESTFSRCHPRVREMLRYVSRERNWVLHDREPVTNWTQGRVTLLGDAAHPTLQYLAQGAQMAIEDAVVLAQEVAACAGDYNRAFLAYQDARMNRTARVVLSSRFFGEWFHADGGARMLRNELARRRNPLDCWEADWLYRGIRIPD